MGVIASLSITAFALSEGNKFYANFIECKEKNLDSWKCFYEILDLANLDLAKGLLVLSFVLIWVFVAVRKKIDNIFICSHYFYEINAVKHLYVLLEKLLYGASDREKQEYKYNYCEDLDNAVQTLHNLKYQVYKEEKLKDYLEYLTNYFFKRNQGNLVISRFDMIPRFDAPIEFNQSKREIRKAIDYIIKCLENNRIS